METAYKCFRFTLIYRIHCPHQLDSFSRCNGRGVLVEHGLAGGGRRRSLGFTARQETAVSPRLQTVSWLHRPAGNGRLPPPARVADGPGLSCHLKESQGNNQ
eukprot:5352343-Pyramimonas_sp.AAC.1